MGEKKLIIPAKKYKGETSVVSARLPNDMIKEIDRIGALAGRNRNEILTMCLEFAIENLSVEADEK